MPSGRPPEDPRGIPKAALLFGIYFVLVVAGVAAGALLRPGLLKDQGALLLVDGAAKVLALAAAAVALRFLGGGGDPGPAPARPAVAAGLLAAVAFLPLMIAAAKVQEQVWKAMQWREVPQELVAFAASGSDLDFVLVLLFAVVLAPVFEEMVFRVHLYSGLRARMGPAPAAVLSAAAFSLIHLQPVTFAVTFLLGLCLAYLRERTGGRSAPIAMHACYNSIQMAGILALRWGSGPATGG